MEKNNEISREDMLTILCCSIEGGIFYWAGINYDDDYEAAKAELKAEGKNYCIEDVILRVWENGKTLKLFDIEGQGCEDKNGSDGIIGEDYWEITKNDYIKAINQYIDEYEINVEEMDADSGDVIMQLAVFNEVVFG